MEWQPIETALKDVDILLYTKNIGIVRGKWDDQEFHKNPKPYWSNDRCMLLGVGFVRNDQPTHWMPLPPPPKAKE